MMNMVFERKLTIPKLVKEMYPLTAEGEKTVSERAAALKRLFSGEDDRLILIVGPCSADAEDSVLEYVSRLRTLAGRVEDRFFIIPRVYTNKPRSGSDGYKGMLHQPDPSGKPDVFRGIVATRELHMRVLSETGFTCADEMLYPENLKYIDDILAYVAVGARSVEDQQHRLTASGLDTPVGMKNPTSGSVDVLLKSIEAAQRPHSFIYRGWAVHSEGNPFAHAVLRGYTDSEGDPVPNYGADHLRRLAEAYAASGLRNPAVIVDTNHCNSGKDPFLQPEIARSVMKSRRADGSIGRLVRGFMIESYLEDGAQQVGGGVFGRSITDPCLGWKKTERMILSLAELV